MRVFSNLIFIIIFFLAVGCEKKAELQPKEFPYVITKDVVNITSTGVTFLAEVLYYGNDEITDFGFIWSDHENVYQASLFETGGSLANFTVRISSDLVVNGQYKYHAYINTVNHQVKGNEVKFYSLGSKLPIIKGFYPGEGFDGTQITIVGKHFSWNPSFNKIFVEDTEAEIVKSVFDTIVFIAPNMAFFGEATISIEVGSTKVNAENKYRVFGPQIESISKISGLSGDNFIIEGENFVQNGENVEVYFGEYIAEITSSSESKLELIVPPPLNSLLSDISVPITVVNGFKTANYQTEFVIEKSWTEKQPTPFSYMWEYKAFTYNGKGYILEMNAKKLYEYDPMSNLWQSISDFPGERNGGSIFVVMNDRVMKFGGYNWLDPENDVWEYNFTTGTWTQKEDIPFNYLCATYFTVNNEVYIIVNNRQVWKYDAQNESFTQQSAFPVDFDYFVSSFIINDTAYVVTYGHTWQYNSQSDSWIEKSTNPFYHDSGSYTMGFALNNTGYVLQSGEELYKYNVAQNKWILTSEYPGSYGSNSYKTTFIIGDKAYVAATKSNYNGGAPLLYYYQE